MLILTRQVLYAFISLSFIIYEVFTTILAVRYFFFIILLYGVPPENSYTDIYYLMRCEYNMFDRVKYFNSFTFYWSNKYVYDIWLKYQKKRHPARTACTDINDLLYYVYIII